MTSLSRRTPFPRGTRGALSFGIVRSIDPTKSRARLADLCEVLGKDIETLVVPHHAESYRELTDDVDQGRVAFAWLPPITCTQIEDRRRGTVLALPVRGGAVSYRAAIIVRKGGPASIEELRGRRMAWVDPDSSSGFLVPRLYLQGVGQKLEGFFGEERFVQSHAAVVEAVGSGRSDAGATYCTVEGTLEQSRGSWSATPRASSVSVLAASGPIPNDAIVVSKTVDGALRSKLLRWLLDLRAKATQKLCVDLFGADAFRVASPDHYQPLRRMLIAARARGTIPPPPG